MKKYEIILPQEEVIRKEAVYGFSPKDLFSHEMHKVVSETRMLRLQKCQVLANGFLLDRFSLLPRPETFWHPPVKFKDKKQVIKRVLKDFLLSKKRVLTEPALVLTDCASGCYFHWIGDVLQKCEALGQVKGSDWLRSITLVVPAMASHSWVRRSLEPFSFKMVKVLEKKRTDLLSRSFFSFSCRFFGELSASHYAKSS